MVLVTTWGLHWFLAQIVSKSCCCSAEWPASWNYSVVEPIIDLIDLIFTTRHGSYGQNICYYGFGDLPKYLNVYITVFLQQSNNFVHFDPVYVATRWNGVIARGNLYPCKFSCISKFAVRFISSNKCYRNTALFVQVPKLLPLLRIDDALSPVVNRLYHASAM